MMKRSRTFLQVCLCITCLVLAVFSSEGLLRVLASPLCTDEEPNPNPPPCGGAYTECSDNYTTTSCPADPTCMGETPNYIAQDCLASDQDNVICINGGDTLCRLWNDCWWELVPSPHCETGEWCKSSFDFYMKFTDECVPPED
jgi:hypothetical protein